MVRVTNDARRRIARVLRSYKAEDFAFNDPPCELAISLGIGCIGMDACHGSDETPECVVRSFTRLADLIDPGPRAEEIAAKAYRAAADYIDWELGDTQRVQKLREQAKELEAMAREREPYDSDTTKPAADTTKCDRETIVALADELDEIARKGKASEGWTAKTTLTISRYTNRIRGACGATS